MKYYEMAYPSIYNDWPLSHNDHPIVGLTARVRHNNGDLTINNGDKPIANKIRLDLGKSCLFLAKKIIRGAHLWKKSS